MCEIVKMTGFSEGTVCNTKRQKSEIKANPSVAKRFFSGNATASKRVLMNYSDLYVFNVKK